jgi:tyrosyl-tRNA synthetase
MKNQKSVSEIIQFLTLGGAEITPQKELEDRLNSGKKLTVKLGADPTAPDLHLGHTIVLSKLRQLQDLGHNIIFLIGDFTARIGDPTGKTKTRPPLSDTEIAKNTKSYFEQVGRIIDISKARIVFNSEWLGALKSIDFLTLLSKVTVARVLERADFQTRMHSHASIGMHELLYPLLQAYDSVALNADIELGGTDQTFNLLMGRFLQEQYGQTAQVIITTPLLEGLNGGQKMSKSLGNAVSLGESAESAFGKLMSISDNLMWHYATLLLQYSSAQVAQLQERIAGETLHPMDQKKEIAFAIVSKFWSQEAAAHARTSFEGTVQNKEFTHALAFSVPYKIGESVWIVDLLKTIKAIETSSEGKRLIEQGAIELNDAVITEFKALVQCEADMRLRVGKHRFFVLQPVRK